MRTGSQANARCWIQLYQLHWLFITSVQCFAETTGALWRRSQSRAIVRSFAFDYPRILQLRQHYGETALRQASDHFQ
jgi:hypothetical protein